jgi:hypothetical protein
MVTASPAPAQPLTVFYNMAGTAHLGTDYSLDGTVGQITIGPGHSGASIKVHALPGQTHKRARTAKIQLSPRSNYHIPNKTGKTATIKIAQ